MTVPFSKSSPETYLNLDKLSVLIVAARDDTHQGKHGYFNFVMQTFYRT